MWCRGAAAAHRANEEGGRMERSMAAERRGRASMRESRHPDFGADYNRNCSYDDINYLMSCPCSVRCRNKS